MGIRRRLQHSGDHGQLANTRGDTSSLLPQGVSGPMLPRQAGYADAAAGQRVFGPDPRSGEGNWDNPSESYAMGHIDHSYESKQ